MTEGVNLSVLGTFRSLSDHFPKDYYKIIRKKEFTTTFGGENVKILLTSHLEITEQISFSTKKVFLFPLQADTQIIRPKLNTICIMRVHHSP